MSILKADVETIGEPRYTNWSQVPEGLSGVRNGCVADRWPGRGWLGAIEIERAWGFDASVAADWYLKHRVLVSAGQSIWQSTGGPHAVCSPQRQPFLKESKHGHKREYTERGDQ